MASNKKRTIIKVCKERLRAAFVRTLRDGWMARSRTGAESNFNAVLRNYTNVLDATMQDVERVDDEVLFKE